MKKKKDSRKRKGDSQKLKTKKWLESNGYTVGNAESTYTVPGTKIFRKKDLFGADLVAFSADHMVFVQVKANRGHMSEGVKQLTHDNWPMNVDRIVVHWPPQSRIKDGPEIREVK